MCLKSPHWRGRDGRISGAGSLACQPSLISKFQTCERSFFKIQGQLLRKDTQNYPDLYISTHPPPHHPHHQTQWKYNCVVSNPTQVYWKIPSTLFLLWFMIKWSVMTTLDLFCLIKTSAGQHNGSCLWTQYLGSQGSKIASLKSARLHSKPLSQKIKRK